MWKRFLTRLGLFKLIFDPDSLGKREHHQGFQESSQGLGKSCVEAFYVDMKDAIKQARYPVRSYVRSALA